MTRALIPVVCLLASTLGCGSPAPSEPDASAAKESKAKDAKAKSAKEAKSSKDGKSAKDAKATRTDKKRVASNPEGRAPGGDLDKPMTVVLVILDTVRAESMSICGYKKRTTPYLERLQQEFGLVGSCRAYSPATWTLPSHATYFTGLLPTEHHTDQFGFKLPPDSGTTLAEHMGERGYTTAMFAANTALAKSGLDRGFHHVRFATDMLELRHPEFGGKFDTFMASMPKDKPLFLVINLIDAHDPYPAIPKDVGWADAQPQLRLRTNDPDQNGNYHKYMRGELEREDANDYLRSIRNGYEYGIYLEDQNVKAMMQSLRNHDRLPGPFRLVITSDHGEFTGEHKLLRHNAYVWEPVVRVPLFFHDNTLDEPPLIDGPVSATVSRNLTLDGKLPDPMPPVQSWSRHMPKRPVKPGRDMTALWSEGNTKLVWGDGRIAQVDLEADPDEKDRTDVIEHPKLKQFEQQVTAYANHLEATSDDEPDADALDALRELGYVE